MNESKFGYERPRKIAENIWEVRGEWKNKLGRRMTVVRLSDGRLVIHSSIQLNSSDLEWLKSIGTPSFIVAPNTFHCSDAGWMAKTFPNAELFSPTKKFRFFKEQGLSPKDVNAEFPTALSSEIKCIPMLGTRIDEAAFVHVPSHTLILCDLAFNMGDVFSGLEKVIMRWNKVGGRFGPSRLTKLVFSKEKSSLVASYQQLLEQDFDRVIVSHGDVLETGGKDRLQAGVAEIFG